MDGAGVGEDDDIVRRKLTGSVQFSRMNQGCACGWVGVRTRSKGSWDCYLAHKQGSLYTQTTGGFHGGSANEDGGDMGEVRT
jgi:hypothetical protein